MTTTSAPSAAARAERLGARRPAVDRHDEAGALGDERLDRARVGAVALEQAVGDIDARGDAVMGEEAAQQRGGRRAVDVVVAEQRHRLALLHRVGEARGRRVHVAQRAGIGQQRLERGVEHRRHVVERDAARGEHAPQQLGQSVPLADGGRHGERVACEPLTPGKPARRGSNPQERRRFERRPSPFAHRAHCLPPGRFALARSASSATALGEALSPRSPQLAYACVRCSRKTAHPKCHSRACPENPRLSASFGKQFDRPVIVQASEQALTWVLGTGPRMTPRACR